MNMMMYGKYYVGNIPVFCGVFKIEVKNIFI